MPFDIGFLELCLVAIIALLILGPERLPVAARTVGTWIGKAKHAFSSVKDEINRELQIEELRKQIKEQQEQVEQLVNSGQESVDDFARTTQAQIEETREAFQKEMEQQTIHPQSTDSAANESTEQESIAKDSIEKTGKEKYAEEEMAEPVELVEYEPLPNPADDHLAKKPLEETASDTSNATDTASPVEQKS